MALRVRSIALYATVIVVIAIIALALVIPSTVSSKKPSAEISVVITDLTTGNGLQAAALVGSSSNGLSVYKPIIPFKPLAEFTQNTSVLSTHRYSVALKALFTYGGTNIKSFNNCTVYIVAEKSINGKMYCMWNQLIIGKVGPAGPGDVTTAPYVYNFFYIGTNSIAVNASKDSTGMNPDDPYTQWGAMSWDTLGLLGGGAGSLPGGSSLKPITGADLDGWVFHCKIVVSATDMGGATVTGTVTADLLLHATVTQTGGSVNLTVNGMTANTKVGTIV